MRIDAGVCSYKKEPLKNPFGFKGSALTCLWQTRVELRGEEKLGVGLGVQSVLWSDAGVFQAYGEDAGNRMMWKTTEYAVNLCRGLEVSSPLSLLDEIFPQVYAYARKITGREDLRTTFVLNALVPLDFAAWQLWVLENGVEEFKNICAFDGQRQQRLANIPLITYATSLSKVVRLAEEGTPLLKIKIGSNPKGDNDLDAMLEWDKKRLLEIHNAVKDVKTAYTDNGHIFYYLDANGRYDTKQRLESLLDFAAQQGILERILLLEEPFDEENRVSVGALPVCVAADESAHCVADVKERFSLGYRALTLKPIAKTLSMTLRMADYARQVGMACFCADLTVNPVMVTWNQWVAARLNCLPHMKLGVIESNGDQNYVNWERMQADHPLSGAAFTKCKNGVFSLGKLFYETNGGIFLQPKEWSVEL